MPTPWLSWPNRLASTRWSATSRASSLGAAVGPADRHGEGMQPVGRDPDFAHLPARQPSRLLLETVIRGARFRVTGLSTASCQLSAGLPDRAAAGQPAPFVGIGRINHIYQRANVVPKAMRGLFRLACLSAGAGRRAAGAGPDPAAAAAAVLPAGRPVDPPARPHHGSDRSGRHPASEIDALREQTSDVRAAAARRRATGAQRPRRHQEPAGAARDQARRRPAARDRRGQGRARAADRAGDDQRKPGQAVRGDHRARRPAARAHDQAARRRSCCRPCCSGTISPLSPTVWQQDRARDRRSPGRC